MRLYVRLLIGLLRRSTRGRLDLLMENLVLRQQLEVYTRQPKRPRLRNEDRLFWSVVARTWSPWPWGANIPSAGQAALRRPVGPSRARSSETSIARLGRTKRSEDPADMTKSARTKGIAVFV